MLGAALPRAGPDDGRHGLHPVDPARTGYRTGSTRLRRFIHEVAAPPVLGVGHSAGAWFGLAAAGEDPDLFTTFVSLDQPLDPQDHLAFHGSRNSALHELVQARRQARGVDELRTAMAEIATSQGATIGELLNEEELRQEAESWFALDPEIFALWVDHSLDAFIMVPELQRWPGAFRGPLLFLDGDPAAGSMVSDTAASYNMAHYPWAERIQLPGLDHGLGLVDDPAPIVTQISTFPRRSLRGSLPRPPVLVNVT